MMATIVVESEHVVVPNVVHRKLKVQGSQHQSGAKRKYDPRGCSHFDCKCNKVALITTQQFHGHSCSAIHLLY